MHVKPEEILFFDDKIPNVEGAKKAGCMAFVFTGVDNGVDSFKSKTKEFLKV